MGNMIKVSDFIANFLAENKSVGNTVFMVSGGGNMHLIDSVGKHNGLNFICNHNEQASTLSAEGYARVENTIGISYVTTGPGGTNAVSGVYSAFVDSIPTLTISGQVKLETTITSDPDLSLRQLGDQEGNIIQIIKPITKYSVMIDTKESIKYHLQRAIYEAKSKRPGPVWIDIPLDIQGAMVDEEELYSFEIPSEEAPNLEIDKVLALLKSSSRPVIIAGNGITLADANKDFLALLEILKIPVVGTFARYDIVKSDTPYFFGRYGSVGNRMANFIVQNSDLLLSIGSRMNIRAISYNWENFAREATKIAVDIDKNELEKHTLSLDLKICADAKEFITALKQNIDDFKVKPEWFNRCQEYKKSFPMITKERQELKNIVDSYNFFHLLSDKKDNDRVYVFGNGTACVSSYQSLQLYKNQKVIVNSGSAAMGYDLPAAIGAAAANPKSNIICVTGEGSLQMNIQELQTIIHNRLNIKIFILNNGGYISIRNTQNGFFNGHKVGADKESGVSFPDTLKLAQTYGFKTFLLKDQYKLEEELSQVLAYDGAIVCEVMLSPEEKMTPKLSSVLKDDGKMVSKPLEDMFPFLDRDEFAKNMIVKRLDE